MGFGVALIGYAFLMLNEIGGAIFAALILAYGFFLASRLNGKFLHASISALFMLPRGIVLACSTIGLFDINSFEILNTVTFLLYLCAWFMMSYFWLSAVINISVECSAKKLERQARNRLVLTSAFLIFSIFSAVLSTTGALGQYAFAVSALQYILQYAVIIINVLFLHTCFVLITSEKQYEKDKQQLAKERANAAEKRRKEQEALKIGKGKK